MWRCVGAAACLSARIWKPSSWASTLRPAQPSSTDAASAVFCTTAAHSCCPAAAWSTALLTANGNFVSPLAAAEQTTDACSAASRSAGWISRSSGAFELCPSFAIASLEVPHASFSPRKLGPYCSPNPWNVSNCNVNAPDHSQHASQHARAVRRAFINRPTGRRFATAHLELAARDRTLYHDRRCLGLQRQQEEHIAHTGGRGRACGCCAPSCAGELQVASPGEDDTTLHHVFSHELNQRARHWRAEDNHIVIRLHAVLHER
eukprot:7386146-Prymnesium_polylepis.1